MKNLKYSWQMIIALALTFALLGCNKSASKAAAGDAGKDQAKQLVYWSLWNKPEPQAQALDVIVEKFVDQPNGAEIKMIYNGRQALVKLRSYLVANKQVDLFDGDGDQYLGLVTKEDFVTDISDIASATKSKLLNGVADTMQVNGVQYGVPYILNFISFFYSKQSFEKAGIDSPPQTFADLLSASQKLLDAGIAPIALEGNVGFYQLWYLTSIAQKVAGQDFLYNAIMDKTGASWDKPEFRQILEIEKQLVDSGAIPAESTGYQYPAAQNNIAIGKTAMELVGSWLPTELSQTVDNDFRWGVFPFPDIPGGSNENKIALAPMTIGIYKKSDNVDTAKAFIQYLLSEDSQKSLVDIGHVGVPNKNVDWPSDLQDGRDMLLKAEGAYLTDGNLTAFLPDFANNYLVPVHTKFIFGKISVDEFIETIKTEAVKYWQ